MIGSKALPRAGWIASRDRLVSRGGGADFGREYAEPLAVRLRRETGDAHQEVERAARLPARIVTIADYIACLVQFHALVPPLERELTRFSGWRGIGIDLAPRRRAPALRADLDAFGVAPARATGALPPLPDFPAALGALYVLEGATLGGAVILRAAVTALGREIAGATAFFTGHGARAGPMWQEFRAALDRFGNREPEAQEAVIAGARRTFACFTAGLRA